ncbi:chaperone NapD [Alkalimarinus alittae]|uniref:Chaperone NapD n=1 Tax=Alkalimarinus alittae TaxID=2961619 RepID=A0ABY6N2X1_9ALTE|nr:chaperone NapD [Alkalimarinus alittae]UZE96436.1 chaperone NapD [Alkalimarinus alittae]
MKKAPRYSNQDYSVAGIVVHARPENRNDVAERLKLLHGVEVHAINDDGKLVVTVEEEPGERFIIDRITEINNTQGVINAALVFSQSEQSDPLVPTDNIDLTNSNVATNLDLEEQQ